LFNVTNHEQLEEQVTALTIRGSKDVFLCGFPVFSAYEGMKLQMEADP
jgi:hypothetical protein